MTWFPLIRLCLIVAIGVEVLILIVHFILRLNGIS